MPLDNRKNFAKATVSTGYDASAVSIVLASGHGARLPAAPFNATWWNFTDYADPSDDPNVEIVRVTGISTDTLTITRAQETTGASVKNSGGKTYRLQAGLTKKTIDDIDAALVQYSEIGFSFDGGGAPITTDTVAQPCPRKVLTAGTITEWGIVIGATDVADTFSIDIQKATPSGGNYTLASITGGAIPTITAAREAHGNASGFASVALAAGDIVWATLVGSPAYAQKASITLKVSHP